MDHDDYRQQLEYTAISGLMATVGKSVELVDDFFAQAPLHVWKTHPAMDIAYAIKRCRDELGRIDLVEIAKIIRSESPSVYTQLGGSVGIAESCTMGLAFVQDVETSAEHVYAYDLKKRALESIQRVLPQANKVAYKPEDLAAELESIQKEINNGLVGQTTQTWSGYFDELQARIDAPNKTLISSPWQNLNGILCGGMEPEEVAVLAARPSVGKTAFALNWSSYVANYLGKPAVYVSLEVGDRQIRNRMLSCDFDINYGKFRHGFTQYELDGLREYSEQLDGIPLHIMDKPRCCVSDIRKYCRSVARAGEIGLVVIDYLQLVKPEGCGKREEQVAQMSRDVKLMARELKCPVLLLAQMNRDGEKENREPRLSDLRESGAIEQDADIVIFLHSKIMEKAKIRGVKAFVCKGRSSGTGVAELAFQGDRQRFFMDTEGWCARGRGHVHECDDNGLV